MFTAWQMMYLAFVATGGRSVDPFALAQSKNPKLTTRNSASRIGECVGAIKRAVQKYGSLELALEAHEAWVVKTKYEYADMTNFIEFAPAGQRAKGVADTMTYKVRTINGAELVKALVANGVERKAAHNIAKAMRFA